MRKLLLLVVFSSGVMANSTQYIGNEVKIPMRSDASITKDNIITKLAIHAPVTLIKKQTNGWSQVEYQGTQGWIISRYLTDTKPIQASNGKLKQQAKQISKLKQNNQAHQQTIVELEQELGQQRQSVNTLKAASAEYDTQVLELSKLRNKMNNLDQTNTDLIDQVKLLKSQSSAMHSTDFLTIISTLMLFAGLAGGYFVSKANESRNNIYTI
ncbi:MAG: TIGR04211 family SH3 domain-containing protein [Gammaproteobacteria bacterium]|nr:TIGR04211 family SH3 domain-containing protein [Gammaproteobacteria bacterium]